MDAGNEDDTLLEDQTTMPTAGSGTTNRFWQTPGYRKFVYCLAWLSITGYMAGVTSAIADNRSIDLYNGNESLGDIGIDFVHLFLKGNDISAQSDAYCVYILLAVFFTFLICLGSFGLKSLQQIMDILIEFGVLINVLFTLRYLNICLTSFPSPSHQILWGHCGKWDNVWIAPFVILDMNRTACHDFFFSGHTCTVTVTALIITKYSIVLNDFHLHWRIFRMIFVGICWVIACLAILFLLVLELHYTIDITTALMLIVVIWKFSQAQRKYKFGFFFWWKCSDDYRVEYL